MGLPHRGYSISAGSDADTENEGVMSPEHAMRLWGRGVKSGRSSCLSSRSNSALTLTDTEHENKSDSENGKSFCMCEVKPPHTLLSTAICMQVLFLKNVTIRSELQLMPVFQEKPNT